MTPQFAMSYCRRANKNKATTPVRGWRASWGGGGPKRLAVFLRDLDMPHHPNALQVMPRGSKWARAIRRVWNLKAKPEAGKGEGK